MTVYPVHFDIMTEPSNPDGILKEIRHLEQYIWAGFLSEWGDLGQKQIEVIQTDNLNSKTDS